MPRANRHYLPGYVWHITHRCHSANHVHESKWTESIAVGSRAFVEQTKEQLGVRPRRRSIIAEEGTYELREPETPHSVHSKGKNSDLSSENTYYWDVSY